MQIGIDLFDIINNFSSLNCRESAPYEQIIFNNKKIIPRVANPVEYFSPDLYTYELNEHGFRSIEFDSTVDILTAGCSFTFGTGIPFEYTWSQQLQKKIPNKKIATISWPGLSIESIISYIFRYFKNIGNPKMIICNFPDFYRFLFLEKSFQKIIENYSNIFENRFIAKREIKIINESVPHPLWGFYINYQYILMLEQYCESNNIKLIWSTWAKSDSSYFKQGSDIFYGVENFYKNLNFKETFKNLNNTFKYYHHNYEDVIFDTLELNTFYDKNGEVIFLKNSNIDYDNINYLLECHQELKKETKDFFEIAYDRYIIPEKDISDYKQHSLISKTEKNKNLNNNFIGIKNGGHWGSHRCMHTAEFYYNIIKEKYFDFIK